MMMALAVAFFLGLDPKGATAQVEDVVVFNLIDLSER